MPSSIVPGARDQRPANLLSRETAVARLLQSAERFLACRERARLHAPWMGGVVPQALGDAIARDFAGFDLEQAEAEFRAALSALSSSVSDDTALPPGR